MEQSLPMFSSHRVMELDIGHIRYR